MNKRKQITFYLITDFITAHLAWFVYDILRYFIVGTQFGYHSLPQFLLSSNLLYGQILFPLFWLILYYYSGYYNTPLHKSRIAELLLTFKSVLIGALLIFFAFILDDLPNSYTIYYRMLLTLICVQFLMTYIPRLCITQYATNKIHHRKWTFPTLIIGTGPKAEKLTNELNTMPYSLGYKIVGYCEDNMNQKSINKETIICSLATIGIIIKEKKIRKIIIAKEKKDYHSLYQILLQLFQYNISIEIAADHYDILTGNAKMSAIYATPLIEIIKITMPEWQKNIKLTLDRLLSLGALIIGLPLFLYLAIQIKRDSRGPILYKQKRVGRYGKDFYIYKFRSMYLNAEDKKPQLSSNNDPRIAPFGQIMRKYRFDELPQFYNVLKGDMSLVGPRPERQYYIDQLIKEFPFYYRLLSVRPGITSWGMVKYGYANSLSKMVDRLYYDIIYIESMSLLVDLKILIYTIRTIITGKGI